ncbi:MAG: peptidoglycan-binding protein, partial [Methylobacteriaceae bacterium]|nr:peptidoglycan-binding protein [Methylobacteriaceae bacterium]
MHAKLRRTFGFGVAAAATFGLALGSAQAETSLHPSAPAIAAPAPAPASPPAPDPAVEASKRAFEALPEDQRKAVQDALMWTGLYHGALDGTFGKGTREALIAFETREKINADAIVDQGEFARLAAAAKKAKEAVRFSTVTDDLTGVRFGLPLKLLTRRSVSRGGTRFASVDDGTVVETQVMREGDIDLAKLFERLKADGPDRKVTYKASRADWFVVSGEAGDKRFYTRIAQGTGPKGAELRGYTLTYPASAPDFERISIAIANSF